MIRVRAREFSSQNLLIREGSDSGIGKMYSNEKETWFTIARSMLAAIGATYVVVLNGAKIDEVMLITEIFLICLVIDVFVKGIITAMNKIIPGIIEKIIGSFKQ